METIPVPESLNPFVKDIYVFRGEAGQKHSLPFYADGFPGIIYSRSEHPFYYMPRNKKLSDFYLYGQTIQPISLDTQGEYLLVGMRLYPFVARILLGVNPKELNDDCYELELLDGVDTSTTLNQLREAVDAPRIVSILTDYFHKLRANSSITSDHRVQLAINYILNSRGTQSINKIREEVYISERTLERKFTQEIGVTPKQFARFIQFSSSLQQVTEENYYQLTEVGFDNGYADQSHFIRTFKGFTGRTPSEFQNQR